MKKLAALFVNFIFFSTQRLFSCRRPAEDTHMYVDIHI